MFLWVYLDSYLMSARRAGYAIATGGGWQWRGEHRLARRAFNCHCLLGWQGVPYRLVWRKHLERGILFAQRAHYTIYADFFGRIDIKYLAATLALYMYCIHGKSPMLCRYHQ